MARADGGPGFWALVRSDYEQLYAYKNEPVERRRLLMVPRMITNACFHATFLIRLITLAPRPTAFVWRRLLLSWHAIDWAPDTIIGPGLELPHPFSIAIGPGTSFGAGVVLHHGVTIGPTRKRWYPDQGLEEWLRVGDGVIFFPHAMALGPITIGDRATIGAKQLLLEDVPADGSAIAGKVRPPRPSTAD
ncbi:hypothetical protein [Patulibacter minatonensis]|uniref:hypothetical protein n=1 Tax=Patulibacter minatonensis TaxID=298163 RepID=UPI000478D7E9|nr:hypothetical protein [Patulibacter minatonensis]